MQTHRGTAVAFLLLLTSVASCQKSSKGEAGVSSQGSGAGSAAAAHAQGSDQGSAQGSNRHDKPGSDPLAAVLGAGSGSGSGSAVVDPPKDIDSKDILARTETTPEVHVKHVLVGWKDLAASYRGHLDPRAAKRSNAEAATLAQEVATKLKANPDAIDGLMKETSEDTASLNGDPYLVKADSPYVPEFKNLALRLKEREVGIVKTSFGYHVMVRVPPPKPDPLESADILARKTEEAGPVHIQQVLIGWDDTVVSRSGQGDPRALKRPKADADKLAKEVLAKARGKTDMAKLMKEYSEDPTSKDTGRTDQLTPDARVPPQFEPLKKMVLRLKLNEAGIVKSPLGWHIIKRVAAPPPPPPPKPDSLDSVEILKREPQTAKAKVKHILLGWTEAHTDDPRGTNRDRATLEKLVKGTVAKLVKGDKIEPLMAELSEDANNAKAGESYDVTPDAGLVDPFKNLSLRLKVGEVGVVKTQFGIHIIKRVE
jgi:parvulin-like peptidyl-prolyl isomerase